MTTSTLFKKVLTATAVTGVAVFSMAQEFTSNNLDFKILNGNSVALIKKSKIYTGDIVVPSTVEYNGISYNVTQIVANTFYKSGITSIEIPSRVTYIGPNNFNSCKSLVSIKVAEDNPNYSSENGILFNKNKTSLIKYPCAKRNVSSYHIPNSVNKLEQGAFDYVVVPEVIIPNSITEIPSGAFYGASVKNVVIPNSITKIGYGAFERTSLETVAIPNSVKEIGGQAFYHSIYLKKIEIPSSVSVFGNEVFEQCTNLEEFVVAEDNPLLSSENGILFNKDKTNLIMYPPKKEDLTSYVIPTSVTTISKYAFGYSFLKELTIPASVLTIENSAFNYSKINTIINKSEKPQILNGMSRFWAVPKSLVVKVPKSSVSLYKEAEQWKDFVIVEIEEETLSTQDNKVISSVSAKIYPNPTTGIFFIETEILPTTANIFTMTGQLVKSVKLNKGKSQVDISHLSSGIYLVKIGNIATKVIKK